MTAVNTFLPSSLLASEGRLISRRMGAHANIFQNTGLFDSEKLIKFSIKIQASCQVLGKVRGSLVLY